MARPYRLQSEDCFYHITSRGNDRKKIFLNDTDFEKFLEYIVKAKEKYDFYLLAYVLMSNHYHLLIKLNRIRAKMVENPGDYCQVEIGKIFKMRAQAVSKAGIKIETMMKQNRKIRGQVEKLISIFQG